MAIFEATAQVFSNQKFDFLILGGGTAGLTVAARLSEDPNIMVGVINAGQYRPGDPVIEVPQSSAAPTNPNGIALLGNPTYDWGFVSTPQPGLNGASLGKVVGGSSAINFIIWQRAAREEYDLWSTVFGNGARWSFSSLLPYFKKAETWSAPPASPAVLPVNSSSGLQQAHGNNGPIAISYNNFLTSVDQPAVQAGLQLGLQENFNPDLGDPTGLASITRNVHPTKGIRMYAGNSYYEPNAQRKNLVLLTEAQVTKLVFDTKGKQITATGVEYIANNKTYIAKATKEFIVSSGAYKTPQILELSGVGNKTILQQLGIPVVLDLPGVGENLQDHPFAGSDFKLKQGATSLDNLRFNSTFRLQQQQLYNSSHQGILTYTPGVVAPVTLQSLIGNNQTNELIQSLTHSLDNIHQTPLQKVQYQAQLNLLKSGRVPFLNMVVFPTGGFASTPEANTSYVTIAMVEVHPFSRGSVHISSSQPLAAPTINPHYFEIPFDAEILVKATQFAERWMLSDALDGVVQSLNTPSVIAGGQDNSAAETCGRQSTNHPIGTTAMAPLSMGGVVDPQLRVYGLQNVRVVDAGIFPLHIGTPPQQTVYAVAEQVRPSAGSKQSGCLNRDRPPI
ncbi:alcohol oxidase [Mycena rosella]|uniref:Alcohol oxidase n=1 Tax=Mycena rosella TaxID=1033263 RepID=A0AAD7D5Z3_MYCRO|nr:alcohol oxidase [Mycena rosella]